MAIAAALFVSKRLQKIAFAAICLGTVQLVTVLASCEPEMSAQGAVRVSLTEAMAR